MTGFLGFILLVSMCATFLAWHTYQRHYSANFLTYVNDTSRDHNGVCQISLADGYINAVRHRDDKTWLHHDQLSNAGWQFGSEPAKWNSSIRAPYSFALRIDNEGWLVAAPFWLIAILGIVPNAALGIVRLRKICVKKSGCCAYCGYDLRATAGMCPECGTVPARVCLESRVAGSE